MKDSLFYLSVVVPIHNEEGNLAELHKQILSVCERLNKSFEIVFVNDGSSDGSLEAMLSFEPLKIINLRKNYGQTAALDAGIKEARGEIVVTLDGDLQNDPADIPKLLEKIAEGYDVVSGWRKNRKDSFMKKFISRGAHWLRHILINDGIHDSGCTLKAYRRECFENLDLFGEMHRFIPALLKLRGFSITEEVVNHRSRFSGKTKYGFSRTLKGFLDMVSVWFWKKFANRPLHLFGGFGLALLLVSFVAASFALYKKVFNNLDLSDTLLSELAMFSFLIGAQFLVFGLLGDIMSKNYYAVGKERPYEIKEILLKDRSHKGLVEEEVSSLTAAVNIEG